MKTNEMPGRAGAALLEEGRARLAAGDRPGAASALRLAREAPDTRLDAHNLIERHALEGAFAQMFGLDCAISPQDDIFHFFAGHPTSNNPLRDYLADGWRTLSELMVLLETVNQPLLGLGSVLEFASGHGRFTRHLVRVVGVERLTVSDVVPGAVDFAEQTFGVKGFVSSTRPELVQWPRRYDLVFVLSLFSHLPRTTWTRWLGRLWEAVAPGGLLVFSTHGDEAIRRAGVVPDEQGFHFVPSSESGAIDPQEYGTAFSSPSFVRAQLQATMGQRMLVQHTPHWFWNHQDAWVLRCSP